MNTKDRTIKWRAWISSLLCKSEGERKREKEKRAKRRKKKEKRRRWKDKSLEARRIKLQRGNEAAVALKISTILFLDRLVQRGENFIVRSSVPFQETVQVS